MKHITSNQYQTLERGYTSHPESMVSRDSEGFGIGHREGSGYC